MGFIKRILGLEKKEEQVEFPYHYIRIVWTESAIHDGIFDDYNKNIERVKNGEIVETISYTKLDLDSLIEVYQIPVVDMTIFSNEKFKFESILCA